MPPDDPEHVDSYEKKVSPDLVQKLKAMFGKPRRYGRFVYTDWDAQQSLFKETLRRLYGQEDVELLIRPIANYFKWNDPHTSFLWEQLCEDGAGRLNVLWVGLGEDFDGHHSSDLYALYDGADWRTTGFPLMFSTLPDHRTGLYDIIVTGNVLGASKPVSDYEIIAVCARALKVGGTAIPNVSYGIPHYLFIQPVFLNHTGMMLRDPEHGDPKLLIVDKIAERDITKENTEKCASRVEEFPIAEIEIEYWERRQNADRSSGVRARKITRN